MSTTVSPIVIRPGVIDRHTDRVWDFMQQAQQVTPKTLTPLHDPLVAVLRSKLIFEEVMETVTALGQRAVLKVPKCRFVDSGPGFKSCVIRPDDLEAFELIRVPLKPNALVEVADGLADVSVVTVGTHLAMGLRPAIVNPRDLAESLRDAGEVPELRDYWCQARLARELLGHAITVADCCFTVFHTPELSTEEFEAAEEVIPVDLNTLQARLDSGWRQDWATWVHAKYLDTVCNQLAHAAFFAMIQHGIDPEILLEEVDKSNLAKFAPGSYRREDGKWMKPDGWTPPAILERLKEMGYSGQNSARSMYQPDEEESCQELV